MNSVPGAVGVLCWVVVAGIVAGRWYLLGRALLDRLVNRGLTWQLLALLLYPIADVTVSADFAQRVFLAVGLMTMANVHGFVTLLDRSDVEAATRRQPRYDACAALVAAGLLLYSALGRPGADVLDGETLIWLACDGWTLLLAVRLGRACLREIALVESLSWRERAAYAVLFAVATFWFVAAIAAVVRIVEGQRPDSPGTFWAVAAVVHFALIAVLISFPLFTALLARYEWDRPGRRCRALRPLWRDLTGAVPEVVLAEANPADRTAHSRLYRMSVEIWDALLHLKPYAPELTGGTMSDYALSMAYAARAKSAGLPPSAPAPRTAVPVGAHDRGGDLRDLLELARVWPHARARVTESS